MRKILLIVPAVIGLSACGNNSRNTPTDTPQRDCVEVLCFHGAKRCATCIAIENGVKEVSKLILPHRLQPEKCVSV